MILGRDRVLGEIAGRARAGETVLVYGPVGIGKTALLDELERHLRHDRPCGRALLTATLGDVTSALAGAYPEVSSEAVDQRRLRSRLRAAVEARRGVILLDHLVAAGTAMRGVLRSLRGTGLGVVIAADAEHERDHAQLRALRLTHREKRLPPLPRQHLRRILEGHPTLHRLREPDQESLIELAAGRPGWIEKAGWRLRDTRFWRNGRLLRDALTADIAVEVAGHYLKRDAGDA